VAAEFLVPMADFRGEHQHGAELHGELDRLAKVFKVSTLVVLRRMRDAGTLVGERYWKAYKAELDRLRSLPKSSGGNFYLTQPARNSRRFSRALIADTLEGNTLFLEASRMLGISSESTFREMSAQLGYMF
jgi:Zn-dependent peptidase ImmA (M78 family)